MSYKKVFYPESKFGGLTDIDGTIVFYTRVNSLLNPSFTVLDVGCGRGVGQEDPVEISRNLRKLRGKVKKVLGIDVDREARENPFIDKFYLLDSDCWPLDNDAIDLIVCDDVLEHTTNPNKFFLEARRVLRNNGYLCIRTPNAWNYIAIFSRLIPNRYHSKIMPKVQSCRKEEDVFPTVYRCNTIRKIKAMMDLHGFESVVYGHEAEPNYLSFSKFAYWLGVLHQKFAPGFLKPAIFAFGKIQK
jgi:SAM-dependent methyltransferase